MLARAAGRKLRRDAFRTPTTLSDQLTLPWLCPALLRRSSNAPAITTHARESRRQRRPSLASRQDARSLATTAELQPATAEIPFNPFQHAWGHQRPSPEMSQLPAWDLSSHLVVRDLLAGMPDTRRNFQGMGTDPLEMQQNLIACLRVGRMDRAASILQRLTTVYAPSAPALVDGHNNYLQALLELTQQDAKDDSMATIEAWYKKHMTQRSIEPNALTFVILIRAAMGLLEGSAQEEKVMQLMAVAHEQDPDIIDEINASPDFTDEEWDMLIRLQPEAFEEPPTVAEVQKLHIGTPAAQKSLIDHGLGTYEAPAIAPVDQKGLGLDSLKRALTIFHDVTEGVPYPHDMEGTKAEKDQAYAYARQLKMEQDSVEAAVNRWKEEDEKLQALGIHGVLNTKPIQAIMYNWYTALVPHFRKKINSVKESLYDEKAYIRVDDDISLYGPWFEKCDPERLAALTVARSINACLRGNGEDSTALKISALATSLGRDVQDSLNTDAKIRRDAFIKKQRRSTRRDLVEKLSKSATTPNTTPKSAATTPVEFEKVELSLPVRTRIGALCLEILLQGATLTVTADDTTTGEQLSHTMVAFHHQVGFHLGKKVGYLVPHPKLLQKLRTESVHSIANVKLPMLVEPKPWSSFVDGGYYTIPQRAVRQKTGDTAQKAYAVSAIENGDMEKVLAGLDVLGKVPWQINSAVFDAMAEAWNNGEGLGGLVAAEPDIQRPAEPSADATFHERAKWSKAVQAYENLKGGLHSQRCFQNFQLETARAFVNEKKIFFPHSIDFRGRAYPIPPILNHIGSDIARGLLKFAHGKELGTVGLQWLKIHLANLYGFDKASLRDREQFAMDNMDEIYDSASNPLQGRRWWTKAEDPWQCLACCMELKNAFDLPDPTRFVSQLPVHQDGTCNGLQHYAALGGDHAGARQVNLEPSDRPQDIYTGVADLVTEMVAKDAAEGHVYAKFMDGHITRKVVKRTVMTNVYGVTFMGAKSQVHDELRQLFPQFEPTEKISSLQVVAMYVAVKIFAALGKIFNGAQEIQYWLGECGDRITTSLTAEQIKKIQDRYEGKALDPYDADYKLPTRLSEPMKARLIKGAETFKTSIIWTTPLKMPIVQPYRKESTQKIYTKIQDITVSRRSPTDAVDKRKQLQAFPPNFIHSLDATHMTLSALKCSELGLDFAAVHDSFWTHASDIPNLNVILRDAFVRMHSEDIIDRLHAEFSARYAGAMYKASLVALADVSQKIIKWRLAHRKRGNNAFIKTSLRQGEASIEEVALESQRQELLNSEDPELRKQGEEMETPTSIWLANQDPKAFASFRLSLLGETSSRKSGSKIDKVRAKVLGAEADAVVNESPAANKAPAASEASADEPTDESDSEFNAFGPDFNASATEVDASASPEKKRAPSRMVADRGTISIWLPLSFPPVPKKGGWDVSRLRDSQYFFS